MVINVTQVDIGAQHRDLKMQFARDGSILYVQDPQRDLMFEIGVGSGRNLGLISPDDWPTHSGGLNDTVLININGDDLEIYDGASFGVAQLMHKVGPETGLPVSHISDVVTIEREQETLIVIAGKTSHSLSILRLDADTTLSLSDHVVDDRQTRIAHVTWVEHLSLEGRDFIFAAGQEGGFSVFEITENGGLVRHMSVVANIDWRLDDLLNFSVGASDSEIYFATRSRFDPLISILAFDQSVLLDREIIELSDVTIATSESEIFLFDGRQDYVLDGFSIQNDILDLSQWANVHSLDQFTVTIRDTTINLEFGGNLITLVNIEAADTFLDQATVNFQTHYDIELGEIDVTVLSPLVDPIAEGTVLSEVTGSIDPSSEINKYEINTDFPEVSVQPFAILGEVFPAFSQAAGNPTETTYGAGASSPATTSIPNIDLPIVLSDQSDRYNALVGSGIVHGAGGNDFMEGSNENDWFHGGSGQDTLSGGQGQDSLSGGQGDDVLYGGADSDVFIFDPSTSQGEHDKIMDFSLTEDKLYFHLDPNVHGGSEALNVSNVDGHLWIDAYGLGIEFVGLGHVQADEPSRLYSTDL